MPARPDVEYPNDEGKYPKTGMGKRIVRIWKLVPTKVAVFETEDREFHLMVRKDALGNLPKSYMMFDRKLDGYLYGEGDMKMVAEHHAKWARAYLSISGGNLPSSYPYWYKERLINSGDHPFESAFDAQTWCRNNGWKEDKKNDGWWSKRVGRGKINMHSTEYWSRDLKIYAYPTSQISGQWGGLPGTDAWETKSKEFYDATQETMPIKGTTGNELEAAAVRVSQLGNIYRPKQKRRVLNDGDKKRIADFNEAVREEVLGGLETYERNEWTGNWNKGQTTRELSNYVVWFTGGLNAYERYFGWGAERTYGPSGFGKKEVGRLFRKVLNQMLKEGLLEYDKHDKKWWKTKTASRVANRYLNGE